MMNVIGFETVSSICKICSIYQRGKLFAGENMRGLSPTSAQMVSSICADGCQQTHERRLKTGKR